jgi:glycosyltransferase involved in cell wall biosynthesis
MGRTTKKSPAEVGWIMKLIAVIMVYNCGEVLLDALKSIDGLVDEIHCFDGRYAYHSSSESFFSSDNTKEIIENFALTSKSRVSYNQLPFAMYETEARTISIEDIVEGDWVFVIDSDERVISWDNGIRSLLEGSKELAYFIFAENTVYRVCRFFKKAKGMKYYYGDRLLSLNEEFKKRKFKTIGIHFIHVKRTREASASGHAQGPHP